MRKTYAGSCHCGAVRFEADIDLAEETSRCNCSICTKARFWKVIVMPDAFRLLSGEDLLAEYRFGSRSIRHRFCRGCGIKPRRSPIRTAGMTTGPQRRAKSDICEIGSRKGPSDDCSNGSDAVYRA